MNRLRNFIAGHLFGADKRSKPMVTDVSWLKPREPSPAEADEYAKYTEQMMGRKLTPDERSDLDEAPQHGMGRAG